MGRVAHSLESSLLTLPCLSRIPWRSNESMSLSSYSSHRKQSPLALMGVTLFRDQGHWVTPDADFQTRNQITKKSTGHFKKPGRECRLWRASRFASFSRLTRCQEGERISSQDAHITMISTIFQDSSGLSPFNKNRDTTAFVHPLKFFTRKSWDRSVMHHGTLARHDSHGCLFDTDVLRFLTATVNAEYVNVNKFAETIRFCG